MHKRFQGLSRHEAVAGYLFSLPLVLGVYLFSIGPIGFSFIMSFMDWNIVTAPTYAGFANFHTLFENDEFWRELLNTVYYAFGSVPIALILSIFLAVALNRKLPLRSLFRTVYFLPSVTMPVAIALVWRWLFNSQYGLVNLLLKVLGTEGPQWLGDPQYIMPALIIVTIWKSVGYNMIILLAALQGVSPSYYEAADLDGASDWQKFTNITLPQISPSIFFLSVMMIMNAMKAFDLVYMFGGGADVVQGPVLLATRTMVYGIYEKAFTYMKMGYASAECVVLFCMILIMTRVQFRMEKKWVSYD